MVADHANYLTFEDPGAVNTVRRALKLAQAGDLLGAAETAGVDMAHAATVSEGLRAGHALLDRRRGRQRSSRPPRCAKHRRRDAARRHHPLGAFRPDSASREGRRLAWPFDNEEFSALSEVVGSEKLWELYMAKLLDDLEKLPAHIVGDFYAPADVRALAGRKRSSKSTRTGCSTSRTAAAWA